MAENIYGSFFYFKQSQSFVNITKVKTYNWGKMLNDSPKQML